MVLTLPFRRCLSTSRLSNSSCRFCKTDCHSDNAWLRSLWLKGEWMSVEIVTGAGGAGPLVWWRSISGKVGTCVSCNSMVDPSEWDLLAIDVLDVPFDRSVQIWLWAQFITVVPLLRYSRIPWFMCCGRVMNPMMLEFSDEFSPKTGRCTRWPVTTDRPPGSSFNTIIHELFPQPFGI